jgi:hypothetical protein
MGLNLTVGTTYYFAVKAQNGQGLWSEVGVSDGIIVLGQDEYLPATGGGLSGGAIAGIAVGSCAGAAAIYFAIRKWVWKR